MSRGPDCGLRLWVTLSALSHLQLLVFVAGELSDPLTPKRGGTQAESLLEGDWDGVTAGQEWAREAPAGL